MPKTQLTERQAKGLGLVPNRAIPFVLGLLLGFLVGWAVGAGLTVGLTSSVASPQGTTTAAK